MQNVNVYPSYVGYIIIIMDYNIILAVKIIELFNKKMNT